MMNYRVKTLQKLEDGSVIEEVVAEVDSLDLAQVLKQYINESVWEENEHVFTAATPEVLICRLDETVVERGIM